MAKKIQAWTEYGPRLERTAPLGAGEMIKNIVNATNQSRGSVLAVLAELDVQIETALQAGRIVKLPNGTHYMPTAKSDGTVIIDVRVNPELVRNVNADFHGKWKNAEHIGKSEAEILDLWNQAHPEDPVA